MTFPPRFGAIGCAAPTWTSLLRTRSYILLDPEPDAALMRFIAVGAESTGFLKGAQGGPMPGWHTPGRDNAAALQRLQDALALRYPEAGKPFWAVRMWTNLVWQPAYLAATAVHYHGALPDLSAISQKVEGIHIDGYRLKPGPQLEGDVETLIDTAGAQLRVLSEAMLDEVNAIVKLKPIPAKRLLTDRMLGIMVRLARQRPDLSPAVIAAHSNRWLAAMGLTGQGELEFITLHDGRQAPIIARKGCCLDYLIEPDYYCASCPKQSDELRLARQRADAETALAG